MRSTPEMPITQRELARRLGLSQSAVSLALADHPRISKEVKERVRAMAEDVRYHVDPRLSALAAYRNKKVTPGYKGTIAWVTNYAEEDAWLEHKLFRDFYHGAEQALLRSGYKLEIHWLANPAMNHQRFIDMLRARGIEGIILAPQERHGTQLDLDLHDFAVVTLSFSLAKPALHVVHGELFSGIETLYKQFVEYGHKNIGLLIDTENDGRTAHHILGAFLAQAYLYDRPGPKLVKYVLSLSTDLEGVLAWIDAHKIDALICPDPEFAHSLNTANCPVPGKVSVAIHLLTNAGDVSGMLLDSFRTGEIAVQRLISLLHNWEKGVPEIVEHIAVKQNFHFGKTILDRRAASVPPRAKKRARKST